MFSPVKLAQNAKVLKKTETIESVTAGGGWVGEPKLDGWRALVHVGEEGVHIWSRAAKPYHQHLPHVTEALADVPADTWLDGEVVVLTDDGDDWGSIQSIMGSSAERAAGMSSVVTFVVFDILAWDGMDMRGLPFGNRRSFLDAAFEKLGLNGPVQLIDQMPATDAALERSMAKGYEGLILKDVTAPYSSGARGHGQRKVKPQEDIDGVVMDFKEGKDSFAGLVGALVVGQYDAGGQLVPVLRCSGMTMAVREEITQNREAWIGRVVEVKHHGRMAEGYRHPQFKRVREDKAAEDCVLVAA